MAITISFPVAATDTSYSFTEMMLNIYSILRHDPIPVHNSGEGIRYELQMADRNVPHFHGTITSSYGMRHNPFTGAYTLHKGVDIRGSIGSAIYASANGVVIFSGWLNGYGNTVIIDHKNGFTTLIAHNQENFVIVGDKVSRKTMIGTIGSTGNATGPHMHVEITFDGKAVNPVQFALR